MAYNTGSDTFARAHDKKRQGFTRRGGSPKPRNLYPNTPEARRRLNSAVNRQHASGWVSDEG